jgi:hypothetical protein
MPIVVTFDMAGTKPAAHNRIQSLFERLDWENLGGSAYRYPKLVLPNSAKDGSDVEDWFNHVIPALSLFRAYAVLPTSKVSKFTIDVQSSTGGSTQGYGHFPKNIVAKDLEQTKQQQFGQGKLVEWINNQTFPY